MNDWDSLVEKIKGYGMDVKLGPESAETLELYFNQRFPKLILVNETAILKLEEE